MRTQSNHIYTPVRVQISFDDAHASEIGRELKESDSKKLLTNEVLDFKFGSSLRFFSIENCVLHVQIPFVEFENRQNCMKLTPVLTAHTFVCFYTVCCCCQLYFQQNGFIIFKTNFI